jgi:hypothetical protein
MTSNVQSLEDSNNKTESSNYSDSSSLMLRNNSQDSFGSVESQKSLLKIQRDESPVSFCSEEDDEGLMQEVDRLLNEFSIDENGKKLTFFINYII